MQMLSFCLNHPQDIDRILDEFREQYPPKYSSILCFIFTSENSPEPNQKICSRINEKFPDVQIVGCTSSGEIFEGEIKFGTILINFIIFETSSIHITSFDLNAVSADDATASISAQAKNIPALKGIGFYTTPAIFNDMPIFTETLSELPESIHMFGGSAYFYKRPGSNIKSSAAVFTKSTWITNGALAVFFSGEDLHINVNSYIGWKQLGRELTITGMKNRTTITTFDNKPAISLYKDYLGIVPEKDFYRPLITFPIIIRRDGHKIARVPYSWNKDGSIQVSGDCRIGEHLSLSYGDPISMRRHLHKTCADISLFAPQVILIFSCVVRRLYLKQDVNLELAPFSKIAPTAGMYIFGEIRRFDEYTNVHLLNNALLSVSFREGEKPVNNPRTLPPVDEAKDERLLLVSGLAHFVTVTNKELEAANRELRYLASTDRLTRLLNRGATESALKESLVQFRRNPENGVGLIMLDLDFFKKVNDTFGHEEGDRVLKEAAKIMQSSIRQSDSAGRWGGEEFMIILPKCSHDAATQIAEKIRIKMQTIKLPDGSSVTASIGAATAAPGDTTDSLYTKLDSLLYTAKKRGRNQVCTDKHDS